MIFLLAGHGGGDSGAVGVNGRTESAETIKLRGLTNRRRAEYKMCVRELMGSGDEQ